MTTSVLLGAAFVLLMLLMLVVVLAVAVPVIWLSQRGAPGALRRAREAAASYALRQ
jgi:hypothetical protein